MSDNYYYDPYERKRRAARVIRQNKLAKIVSVGVPIDGDPVETRKPVQKADSLFDAVMEAVTRDMYSEETRFFDSCASNGKRFSRTVRPVPDAGRKGRSCFTSLRPDSRSRYVRNCQP